jgi:DNA-binding transcriptional MerR regulator
MLTVTKLARRCGVSRTALLYYESIGLMPPPLRSGGNYRCYSERDAEQLSAIRAYRNAGLTLDDIRQILKTRSRAGGNASEVLKRRLVERPSARDSEVAGDEGAAKGRNGYEGEVGFDYAVMWIQRRADASMAR